MSSDIEALIELYNGVDPTLIEPEAKFWPSKAHDSKAREGNVVRVIKGRVHKGHEGLVIKSRPLLYRNSTRLVYDITCSCSEDIRCISSEIEVIE